jgi:hypothetical protein
MRIITYLQRQRCNKDRRQAVYTSFAEVAPLLNIEWLVYDCYSQPKVTTWDRLQKDVYMIGIIERLHTISSLYDRRML